ncbi:MAG: aldehyde dehydrogenase family protein [Tissierellia bacterium]|nr:aldehyde dehydrogenase family protein [Tissierellia bacterium]
MNDIDRKYDKIKDYFENKNRMSLDFKISQIANLEKNLKKYEDEIYQALQKDLNKSKTESYMTEFSVVIEEIKSIKKNIHKILKTKKSFPALSQLPASLKIIREAYGSVLIVSPWNYPLVLSISPLVAAIAGGNTCLLKLSDYSKNISELISKICYESFEDGLVEVVIGGRNENEIIFGKKFDYIFFTGSPNLGKIVMSKAAENLTPLTLELGGKSPCVVEKTADIQKTAKRIAFGKLINSGQTCVAPDYIYAQRDIKAELIDSIINEINISIPSINYFKNDFGKIINKNHFDRLFSLIDENKLIDIPGKKYPDDYIFPDLNKIHPLLIEESDHESQLMNEEIFGPIFPILEWKCESDLFEGLKRHEKPLAMYIFTNDKSFTDNLLSNVDSGGVCINDTLIHMASSKAPFGGVGNSGLGNYHGKWSLKTFTRERTILKKWWKFDIKYRYQPYSDEIFNILKKLLK